MQNDMVNFANMYIIYIVNVRRLEYIIIHVHRGEISCKRITLYYPIHACTIFNQFKLILGNKYSLVLVVDISLKNCLCEHSVAVPPYLLYSNIIHEVLFLGVYH